MKYIVKEIMGSEVETINFNRMIIEFTNILNTKMIVPDKVEKVTNTILDILEDFRLMEQGYPRYCDTEYKTYLYIVDKCNTGVIEEVQKYPDPNRVLRKEFEDFMIRAERVLRYRKKLCVIFFDDETLLDGKKRRVALNQKLKERKEYIGKERYESYSKMIRDDVKWITDLSEIRAAVEHVENLELRIKECGINIDENNEITFIHQYLKDYNSKVNKYMNITFYNLYTYVEDFIAFLMNLYCEYPAVIDLIKEEKNVCNHEWYSIDLGQRRYVINAISEFMDKIQVNNNKNDFT